MKSFFKCTAIQLAILGAALQVHAATSKTTCNNDAAFATLNGAFLGGEGLDIRAHSDLDYYTLNPGSVAVPYQTFNVDATYQWNWRIYGGIKFTERDDLTLSWMQIRNDNTTEVSSAVGFSSTPRWLVPDTWQFITGKVSIDLDDVYAVWGHTFDLNSPWVVRVGAGVEYARLNDSLKIFESIPSTGFATVGYNGKTRINGIGPRVELNATYQLPHGFALYGKTNLALLASKRSVSLASINENPGIIFSSEYATRFVAIPVVGIRLGGSYTHFFGQCGAEGVMCRLNSYTIDLGWQSEVYVHAVERPSDSGFGAAAVVNMMHTSTQDYSDAGFFVGLKINSDWI